MAKAGDKLAVQAFIKLGEDLATIVIPWLKIFEADSFIIGGKIANASAFFLPSFENKIKEDGCNINISISSDNEAAALLGATSLIYEKYFSKDNSFLVLK